MFARRIGADAHLAREAFFLRRLFDALTGTIEFPAMIDATDVVALDPSQMHQRETMRTTRVDQMDCSRRAAIEREILAHDSNGLCFSRRDILAPVHGDPELSHEDAARRPRLRRRQIDPKPRCRTIGIGAVIRRGCRGHGISPPGAFFRG